MTHSSQPRIKQIKKKDTIIHENTQCPYCKKEYKSAGFWLNNHLMLKHRKGFEIQTFIIDIFVITIFVGGTVNAVFYYGIIDQIIGEEPPAVKIEKTQFELLLNKKLSEWDVSECSQIVDALGNKFPPLNCGQSNKQESSNKQKPCTSKLTVENGAILVDNCDIAYTKSTLSEPGYAIGIRFKPVWKLEESSVHYLLDIISGNDSERNRVSLYVQNGYLKYSIFNKYGNEEHLLKFPLKNSSVWNEQDFNKIEIGWFGDRMFLDLNGNNINKVTTTLDLDLSESLLFLGTSVFEVYQANGYFDFIYVRKYVYPEPSVELGPVESAS